MAAKGAWYRFGRRSVSSASTASSGAPTDETATASSTAAAKQPGRLASWLGGSPPQKKKKARKAAGKARPARPGEEPAPGARHPSERPLTAANLRHQEMLSGFRFQFGRRGGGARGAAAGSSYDGDGVSPGCSRQASADGAGPGAGGAGPAERRVSSLAREPTREE